MKLTTITITTIVEQDMKSVFAQFDNKLFDALQPPFPPVEILRFDGSKIGDEVHVKLFTGWKKEVWKTRITERVTSEVECYFADEGYQQPWFLKFWKHRHRVRSAANGCIIIDDIQLAFPNAAVAAMFYPVIYGQLAWRRHIYRRYFRRK